MSLFFQEKSTSLRSAQLPLPTELSQSTASSFQLELETWIPTLQSHALFYTHPSGAEVVIFKNKDNMRRFSVGFKTQPQDNSGLAHITEHLVMRRWNQLQSSDDAMASLLASTFHSDLNATTDSLFTSFFVAGRESNDFHKLVRYCLDVTTKPSLNKSDFASEIARWENMKSTGWYQTGTLLNEMRAENSTPHGMLFNHSTKLLFGDHPLGVNFGGDTDEIIKLSIKDVRDFHTKNYCPANSRFFIYGNVDPASMIEMISDSLTKMPAISDLSPKLPKKSWTIRSSLDKHKIQISNLPFGCQSVAHIVSALNNCNNQDLAFIESIIFPALNQETSPHSLKGRFKGLGYQCAFDFALHALSPIPTSSITLWNLPQKNLEEASDFLIEGLAKKRFTLSARQLRTCLDDNNMELKGMLSSANRGAAIMEKVIAEWCRHRSAASICSTTSFDILTPSSNKKLQSRAYELLETIAYSPSVAILATRSLTEQKFPFTQTPPASFRKSRADKLKHGNLRSEGKNTTGGKIVLTPWPSMKSLSGRADIAYQATTPLYRERPPIVGQVLLTPQISKGEDLGDLKLLAEVLATVHERRSISHLAHAPNSRWNLTFDFDLLNVETIYGRNKSFFSLQGVGYGHAEKHLMYHLDTLLRHQVRMKPDEIKETLLDFLLNESPTFLSPLENLSHAMNRAEFLCSSRSPLQDQCDDINFYQHLQTLWQRNKTSKGVTETIAKLQYLHSSLSKMSHTLVAISGEPQRLPECLDQIPIPKQAPLVSKNIEERLFCKLPDEGWIIPGEVGTIAIAIPLGEVSGVSRGAIHVAARLLELEYTWPALRLARGAYNINVEFNHDKNVLCLGASCLIDLYDGFNALMRCGKALTKMPLDIQTIEGLQRSVLSLLDGPQDPIEKHNEALHLFLEVRDGPRLSRNIKHEITSCTAEDLHNVGVLIDNAVAQATRVAIAPKLLLKIMPNSHEFNLRALEVSGLSKPS